MAEAFQVIFNSQGKNVLDNTNLSSVSYNVNWGAFLPKKYKKFHCQFVFKSQNYNGALTNNGFVNINMGRVSVFDGQQMSNNLGVIYPQYLTAAAVSYYTSTNNDNNDFWIDYPINTSVTVSLNTFAGAPMANVPHYVIMLNLIGIDDEDILINDPPNKLSHHLSLKS